MSNSKLLLTQNEDMRSKIYNLRRNLRQKEKYYIQKLTQVEETVFEKREIVSAVHNEIGTLQEYTHTVQKRRKADIKKLECGILEAEKSLTKMGESYNISKQYEGHRLQILRDKQKALNDVICKDSYQCF